MDIVTRMNNALKLTDKLLKEPLDPMSIHGWIRRAIGLILFTQYVNALRISEAVECIYKYLGGEYEEVEVDGRKVKRALVRNRKAGNIRTCVIPDFTVEDVKYLRFYYHRHSYNLDLIAGNVSKRASSWGIRTHDLRRHHIATAYLEDGLSIADIQKLTAHKYAGSITKYYIKPVLNYIFGVKGERSGNP